jgi:hypothetical protein
MTKNLLSRDPLCFYKVYKLLVRMCDSLGKVAKVHRGQLGLASASHAEEQGSLQRFQAKSSVKFNEFS